MTRPLRIEVPDGIYHVTSRGNSGQPVFRDHVDRRMFLRTLARAIDRYGWRCLSYCLLGTHYHLLLQTPRPNLSIGMRHVNGVYAQRFNQRHERHGHVFQGRYKSVLVERDEHLLWLFRYIARNPVEAGLCSSAADWPWGSHPALLGIAPPDRLVDEDALALFGGDRERYGRFVDDTGEHDAPEPKGVILGSDAFVADNVPVEQPSREVARAEWQPLRPELEILFGVYEDRDEASARAYRDFGYRLQQIADHLGCSSKTVSRRLHAWEEEMSELET